MHHPQVEASKLPILNIEDFRLEELAVRVNPHQKGSDEGPMNLRFAFEPYRASTDTRHFDIKLSVQSGAGGAGPYTLATTIVGSFSIAVPLPDDGTLPANLGNNALAILYGVLRGILATATSNFGKGRLVLPTAHFLPMIEMVVKNEERRRAAKMSADVIAEKAEEESKKRKAARSRKKPKTS